jgi:hypothetical protein
MASAGVSLKECSICCDEKNVEEFFTCFTCKYSNCIDCHKIYLLQSMHDPHCMNSTCRIAIPYDDFLDKFGENWVFGKYKTQKTNILFEHEKTLMANTVSEIAKQTKITELKNEKTRLLARIKEVENEMYDVRHPDKDARTIVGQKRKLFTAKTACPLPECKGFLNEEYLCLLCNSSICDKCFTKKNDENSAQEHVCDADMVETYNTIKKEAKPCPSCGEFISKISGCDQMFCITCGTAFSWNTGKVEKGIIHNPHAFNFFENNHEARDRYLQLLYGNNPDGCRRTLVPPITFLNGLNDYLFFGSTERKEKLLEYYERIAEMTRDRFENAEGVQGLHRYIEQDHIDNQDIRMKYIKNDIDENNFKSLIHRRAKRVQFKKEYSKIVITTYEICFNLFWSFHDEINEFRKTHDIYSNGIMQKIDETNGFFFPLNPNPLSIIIDRYFNMLVELSTETIKNTEKLCEKFGYSDFRAFDENFRFCGKIFRS